MSLSHKLAISGTWLSPLAFVLLSGCGGPRVTHSVAPEPAGNTCLLGQPGVRTGDTISILLDRGAGPAFVARQSFETLVGIDCEGKLVPGLARSWRAAGGGSWRVELRDEVRFWSGKPLTAATVLESWNAARADSARALATAMAASTRILDDSTLLVQPPAGDITILADPRLSVIAPGAGGEVEGTGAFRALLDETPQNDWTLVPAAGGGPVLSVAEVSSRAMRDSLDAGAAIVISRDASVARYGAQSPSMLERPLPWSRRYVLITSRPFETGDSADSAVLAELGAGLASDAVRADARSAFPFADPAILEQCLAATADAVSRVLPASSPETEIAFDRNDPIARSIAERLVALSTINGGQALGSVRFALSSGGERLATRASSTPAFAEALASRSSLAYVLAVPLGGAGRCSGIDELVRAAPWLDFREGAEQILPLVDVRSALLVRQGAPRLVIGAGGSLLVAPAERPSIPRAP